jgi:hypothetical protein
MRRISGRHAAGLAAALTIAAFGPLAGQAQSVSAQSTETQRVETRVDTRAETEPRVSLPPSLAGLRGQVHLPKYRTSGFLQSLVWMPSASDIVLDDSEGGSTGPMSLTSFASRRAASAAASGPSGSSAVSSGTSTASSPTPGGAAGELDGSGTVVSLPPSLRGTRGEIKRAAYAYTASATDPGQVSYGDPDARGKTIYGQGPQVGEPGGGGGDPTGWTPLIKSADTRVVYVSSSEGSDLNNGLSESTPVKTIAKGKSLVRMGYPDWLLLKSGDEWEESLGRWNLYGRSESERLVVSSYGEGPRPLLKCGGEEGLSAISNEAAHAMLTDLDFWAHTRDPSQPGFDPTKGDPGVFVLGAAEDLTIEGCRFRFFTTGVILQDFDGGKPVNVRVRRNVVADSYSTTSHSQGLFARGCKSLLIEENLFDHNGWHETIPDAEPTMFNHNCYLNGKEGSSQMIDLVVRGNIFANGSSFGMNSRGEAPGAQQNALVEDNLFLRNANGLSHGAYANGGIVNLTVRNNVFMELGRSLNGTKQSLGLLLESAYGVVIEGNVFAKKPYDSTSFAISLYKKGFSYRDIRIDSNVVWDWYKGRIVVNPTALEDVVVSNNTLKDPYGVKELQYLELGATGIEYRGNQYNSVGRQDERFRVDDRFADLSGWVSATGAVNESEAPISLYDPTRDVAKYDLETGGSGTVEGFLARARLMSRDDWDESLSGTAATAWLREGYTPVE